MDHLDLLNQRDSGIKSWRFGAGLLQLVEDHVVWERPTAASWVHGCVCRRVKCESGAKSGKGSVKCERRKPRKCWRKVPDGVAMALGAPRLVRPMFWLSRVQAPGLQLPSRCVLHVGSQRLSLPSPSWSPRLPAAFSRFTRLFWREACFDTQGSQCRDSKFHHI